MRRPENTHGEVTGLLEWPVGVTLHLRNQWISPYVWATGGSQPTVQNYIPYIIFLSLKRKYEYPLCHTYFLFIAGYRNLLPFFSGNLLILSANGNICHSIRRQLIIFFAILLYFLDFINVILRRRLNPLSLPTSPAKSVYYTNSSNWLATTFNGFFYCGGLLKDSVHCQKPGSVNYLKN